MACWADFMCSTICCSAIYLSGWGVRFTSGTWFQLCWLTGAGVIGKNCLYCEGWSRVRSCSWWILVWLSYQRLCLGWLCLGVWRFGNAPKHYKPLKSALYCLTDCIIDGCTFDWPACSAWKTWPSMRAVYVAWGGCRSLYLGKPLLSNAWKLAFTWFYLYRTWNSDDCCSFFYRLLCILYICLKFLRGAFLPEPPPDWEISLLWDWARLGLEWCDLPTERNRFLFLFSFYSCISLIKWIWFPFLPFSADSWLTGWSLFGSLFSFYDEPEFIDLSTSLFSSSLFSSTSLSRSLMESLLKSVRWTLSCGIFDLKDCSNCWNSICWLGKNCFSNC